MSRKMKLPRFGKKYGFFLSDASNEEIVSISKELSDEMSDQARFANGTSIAVLGIAVFSVILSILLISGLDASVSGSAKSTIFLFRMISVAFFGLASLVAYVALANTLEATSVSTLLWRHVREPASDENAYEQMQAVRKLGHMVILAKNLVRMSLLILVIGGLMLGTSYIYQMMILSGYI